MKYGTVAALVATTIALTSCGSLGGSQVYVKPGASPPAMKVTSTERQLAACYARTKWNRAKPLNIAIRKISDETGQATYGDYGTGTTYPNNNINVGVTTLMVSANRANNPLRVFPRGKDMMDTIAAESSVRMRGGSDIDVPRADYYLNGTISGSDSVAAATAQMAIGPIGGGPSKQNVEVSIDVVLEDWRTTEAAYTTTIKKQYVQTEMKAMFADITNVFGGRRLATAEVESVQRSMMQGIVRELIESAWLDLVQQIPGTPENCNADVRSHLPVARI